MCRQLNGIYVWWIVFCILLLAAGRCTAFFIAMANTSSEIDTEMRISESSEVFTALDGDVDGPSCQEQGQPKPPSDLTCLSCFKEVRDRQTFLIIICATLYFFAITMSSIPLTLLINRRIAGDANDPNAKSAFVQATNSFIYSGLGFLFGRYTSGLSDYLGRKPLLIISASTMILSRIVYILSRHPSGFYLGGLIGGAFDCFYFTSLAWICDVYPEGSRRSKRVGVFTGVVGGFAFIIGVPLGAALAEFVNPSFPLKIGILLGGLCVVVLIILPVDDTLGLKYADKGHIVYGKRMIPSDYKAYMKEHFPVSFGTIDMMKLANHPNDWLVNFIGHSNTSLLALIFVQYALAVFHWSPVQAAGGYLAVGISIGVLGPVLLHRFQPVPLAFRGLIVFTVGLILFAVAGTGMAQASLVAIAGIVCIASGTSWVPALQTNLLSQYGPDVQGAVSGLLGQQKDAALVPAYIMSLGFTVSLGNDGPVYWPGSTFAVAALLGLVGIWLHYRTYGTQATTLTRRKVTGVLVDPLLPVGDDAELDRTGAVYSPINGQ